MTRSTTLNQMYSKVVQMSIKQESRSDRCWMDVQNCAWHNELKCGGKDCNFGSAMHCMPQRLKSMFLEKNSSGEVPKGPVE